jgi:large subunit ribosomal protein L28
MARTCDFCGKGTASGAQIARRGLPKKQGGIGLRITGISLRKFKANIQRVTGVVNGVNKRVKICGRCIKAGKLVKPRIKKQVSGAA